MMSKSLRVALLCMIAWSLTSCDLFTSVRSNPQLIYNNYDVNDSISYYEGPAEDRHYVVKLNSTFTSGGDPETYYLAFDTYEDAVAYLDYLRMWRMNLGWLSDIAWFDMAFSFQFFLEHPDLLQKIDIGVWDDLDTEGATLRPMNQESPATDSVDRVLDRTILDRHPAASVPLQ